MNQEVSMTIYDIIVCYEGKFGVFCWHLWIAQLIQKVSKKCVAYALPNFLYPVLVLPLSQLLMLPPFLHVWNLILLTVYDNLCQGAGRWRSGVEYFMSWCGLCCARPPSTRWGEGFSSLRYVQRACHSGPNEHIPSGISCTQWIEWNLGEAKLWLAYFFGGGLRLWLWLF